METYVSIAEVGIYRGRRQELVTYSFCEFYWNASKYLQSSEAC